MKSAFLSLTLLFSPLPLCHAQGFGVPAKTVVDGRVEGVTLKPSSDQVTFNTSPEGITVTIRPGDEGYPGITVTNQNGEPFDLSKHGHVKARVTNHGSKVLGLNLRLDNAGDWQAKPYNAESSYLQPGETGEIHLIFGHSHGRKKSFPLKPEAITQLLFFTGKSDAEQKFTISSLIAGGAPGELPPVDPATIRIRPEDDVIYAAGSGIDAEKQLSTWNQAVATVTPDGIRGVYPGGKDTGTVVLRPAEGRWDLSQFLQVIIQLKNDGSLPVSPKVRLESNGGPSDSIEAGTLQPGESKDITIPFASKETWIGDGDTGQKDGKGSKPRPGTKLTSDSVSAVIVAVENIDREHSLVIRSVRAGLPPAPEMPAWLGTRPPVEGDWTLTFEDNFDGTAADPAKWNIHAENYWDKASAFSKDNLIVKDGHAILRYERKTSHHNDDPAAKEFDYTTGFLDTYGKWVQRYGYFETRTKIPTAPGLWPAFWLMPDRGPAAGEKWQRQSTDHGGMEFDILEHLTRWGPYRFNIAMHWDGYGKNHKAIGSSYIYLQPDKDGYITTGLLWTPGSAVYYYNGVEAARWETTRIMALPAHMLFTLPQGGWDNSPVDDTQLPADFLIDYVRVWQRKDLASDADTTQSAAPNP